MRSSRWWGGGSGGTRDIEQIAAAGQTSREQRRAPRVEICFAREAHVQWLEPFGRLEQLARSLASGARGRGNLAAQQLDTRALKFVQHSVLRRRQQSRCRVKRAGVQAGLRGGQRTARPVRGVSRQCGGTFEEGRS